MKLLSSEARNETALAISSTVPDGRGVCRQSSSANILINLLFGHPERGVVARCRDDARTNCIHPNLSILEVADQVRANERIAAFVAL